MNNSGAAKKGPKQINELKESEAVHNNSWEVGLCEPLLPMDSPVTAWLPFPGWLVWLSQTHILQD